MTASQHCPSVVVTAEQECADLDARIQHFYWVEVMEYAAASSLEMPSICGAHWAPPTSDTSDLVAIDDHGLPVDLEVDDCAACVEALQRAGSAA